MPFDTQPILWQVKPKWLKQQKGTSCCCSSFCCFKLNGGVPTIGGFKMMCLFSRLGGKIKHHLDPGSLASPWGLTARAADMEENITRWGEFPPKSRAFRPPRWGKTWVYTAEVSHFHPWMPWWLENYLSPFWGCCKFNERLSQEIHHQKQQIHQIHPCGVSGIRSQLNFYPSKSGWFTWS